MRILNLILLIFFIALLTGCSNRTAVLMDDYQGQKVIGKDLTIVRLFERPSIANGDDVVDDLGSGIPEEIFSNFFDKNFEKGFEIRQCCNKINYINKFSVIDLEEKVLEINSKEKMKIFLPFDNSKLDSISSDFILFIDNLQVSRIPGSSGTWIGGNYSGGSFGKLYHQIYFAFWDNTKGKIVSYGRVSDESTIVFGMTKSNWESVLEGLASQILNYSPFPVKYSYFR